VKCRPIVHSGVSRGCGEVRHTANTPSSTRPGAEPCRTVSLGPLRSVAPERYCLRQSPRGTNEALRPSVLRLPTAIHC
jgi:hypothetical protein